MRGAAYPPPQQGTGIIGQVPEFRSFPALRRVSCLFANALRRRARPGRLTASVPNKDDTGRFGNEVGLVAGGHRGHPRGHEKPVRPIASSALLLSIFAARADQAADQTELLRLEKEGVTAILAGNVKALGDFFATDWKIVGSDAGMMNREQLFKAMEASLLKFASYEQSDLEVRVYGDAAVVIGTGKSKGEWKGESFSTKERFTDVFIRQDGKWRCVSTHTSDFPDGGN